MCASNSKELVWLHARKISMKVGLGLHEMGVTGGMLPIFFLGDATDTHVHN
jgi:hypothetical protein